jgi:hypothetical protein
MARATIYVWELDDAGLPAVYMCCGSRADHFRRMRFRWAPCWLPLLFLLNPLVWMVVWIAMAKSIVIPVRLCHQHRNYWRMRNGFIYYGFMLVFLACVGYFLLSWIRPGGPPGEVTGWIIIGFLTLGVVTSAAFIQMTSIAAKRITDEGITLIRLHPDFADALQRRRQEFSQGA